MFKLTKNKFVLLDEEKSSFISKAIFDDYNPNYHYLSFDRQIIGFSPLGSFTSNITDVRDREKEIINKLLTEQKVQNVYPAAKLTFYPLSKIEASQYYLELDNIENHFKDILNLNDNVYKTKNMFVDFGHGATNLNINEILPYLRILLNESTTLKKVYFDRVGDSFDQLVYELDDNTDKGFVEYDI